MEIYLEYVIIDNMVINALILLLVQKTLKLKSNWRRIILGAGIGTAVACILPLFNLSSFLQLPIKIVLGVVMVLVLARFVSIKMFSYAFLLLLGYTILLAGGCMALLLMFGTSIEALSAGGYDMAVPYGIIMLIVSLYVYVIGYIARFLSRKRDINPFIRKIRIEVAGKSLDLVGFIDSGNKLYDRKSGLPVIIISLISLEKHFSKEELEALMIMQEKGNSVFKNVHTTPYGTVSGDAKRMVVFEADKLIILDENKEKVTNNFMVGVSFSKFKDAIKYDMLLHPSVV